MAAHSFTLVPAAYLIILRERASGGPGVSSGPGSPSGSGPVPEVLLQLRAGTGYMDGHWACGVAGHVEPGESVLEAAVREAAEEVGIDVEAADLEPLTTLHRSGDVGGAAIEQRVDFFLVLRRWSGLPTLREAARTADLGWFPLDDLPEPVPPHERVVLRRLLESLRGGAAVPAIMTFGFNGETIELYGAQPALSGGSRAELAPNAPGLGEVVGNLQ